MSKIDSGIWQIKKLLNPSECVSLIEKSEANGFQIARMQSKGRNNRETFLRCPETIQLLSVRLSDYISKEQSADFQVVSLGEILEFYRYQEGEFVKPHCDASKEIKPNIWFTFTLVIYLSDDFQGGDTVFPERGIRIRPQLGSAVLFNHSILHGGAPVLKGKKYIIRTDVAVSNLTKLNKFQSYQTSATI